MCSDSEKKLCKTHHAQDNSMLHHPVLCVLVCYVNTIEPARVVLVGPHGRVFPKCTENGRVRSHKIDVHSSVELAICPKRRRDQQRKRRQKWIHKH